MSNAIITYEEAQMLEWHTLLSFFQELCSTQIGKEYCANIKPLQYQDILNQYSKINCIKEILTIGHFPDFSGIESISTLCNKAAKGATLGLDEIFKIRSFLVAQHKITNFFKSLHYDTTVLHEITTLHDCNSLFNLLISSITENGNLNEHTYPTLRKIKNSINELRITIEKNLNSLIHSSFWQSQLQEKTYTVKNNRYVIPVKSSYKNQIKGTILDISSSGATIFIEPDSIHELNNALLYKELELQREIDRILQRISYEIGLNADHLKANENILAYLDFCTAVARFALMYNANTPAISTTPYIECINARHPLLSVLLKDKVIPCNISCGKNFNCLIISGVNTGGKTVLLKMLGLFALMVRHGLPITANIDSTIGYFEKIFVDIGDEQNILQSLSTFSGQIKNIIRILHEADDKSLILIDEIIVGTDPKQGAAIAQAILEELVSKNSIIAVTTHYSQLKEIPSFDNRFENASVIFDIHSMKPTFQVIMGIPGASYTIEIAKNLYLPEKIINKALSLLDSPSQSTDALLTKITEQSHALQQKEKELAQLKEELQKAKEEYSHKITELQATIEKVTKEQAISFLNELQEYRNILVNRVKELQSLSMKEATNIINNIDQIQNKIRDTIKISQNTVANAIPCNEKTAILGTKVYVPSLQLYGTIEDVDYKNNTVKVLIGAISSRFSFDEVFCIAEPKKSNNIEKKGIIKKEKESFSTPITIQTQYNTIDLRGLHVYEALQKLDYGLDEMIKKNIHTAIVIHGHGTGSLKKAVREYLSHSFYVKNYRPGELSEGGDGVTIIQLR